MERDNVRKFDLELPELRPGESPILRVVRGEDGVEREVEDVLLPRLILNQSMKASRIHTVDQLIALYDKADPSTVRRIFRQDGITYQILSIKESYGVGEESRVQALDGSDIGRKYYVDIKRGASRVYQATRAEYFFENFAE